jgi:hypothetical protein
MGLTMNKLHVAVKAKIHVAWQKGVRNSALREIGFTLKH